MKEKLMKKLLDFLKRPVGMTVYLLLVTVIQIIMLNLNFAIGLLFLAITSVGTIFLFTILDELEQKEHRKILKEEYEIIANKTKDLPKEKQKELENILDSRLNDIKREKKELENLREILNNKEELINITNVYVFEHNRFKNIVDLKETSLRGSDLAVRIDYCDIFSQNIINTEYGKYIEQINNYNDLAHTLKLTKIEKVEPALLAYPSKLLPKSILQEIYYNINNIDISTPILRKRIEHSRK